MASPLQNKGAAMTVLFLHEITDIENVYRRAQSLMIAVDPCHPTTHNG